MERIKDRGEIDRYFIYHITELERDNKEGERERERVRVWER